MKQLAALIVFCIACVFVSWDIYYVSAQAPHGTASEEVPRGTIDGINATFTLNFQPAPWGSIHIFRNGIRMQRGNPSGGDYILGGPNHMQIIFQPACIPSCIPQPGDTLLADYTY